MISSNNRNPASHITILEYTMFTTDRPVCYPCGLSPDFVVSKPPPYIWDLLFIRMSPCHHVLETSRVAHSLSQRVLAFEGRKSRCLLFAPSRAVDHQHCWYGHDRQPSFEIVYILGGKITWHINTKTTQKVANRHWPWSPINSIISGGMVESTWWWDVTHSSIRTYRWFVGRRRHSDTFHPLWLIVDRAAWKNARPWSITNWPQGCRLDVVTALTDRKQLGIAVSMLIR